MPRLTVALLLLATTAPVAALDLTDYPEITLLIEEFSARHGFDQRGLTRQFAAIELQPDVVTAIENPREALPWHEYRRNFINDERIRRGLAYWDEHAALLERARREYGVPEEIVLGIIGVETQYGRQSGRYRPLDALVTLWLRHPPRREFFRREIEELLLLARDTPYDVARLRGSYAGALGIPQFIPSSFRRYAVDHDGDGKRDLIASHADAIGSVANFLREHGFKTGEPVSDEARLEGTYYFWVEKLGLKPALRLADLAGYGIFPAPGPRDPEKRAALIALEGEDGPIYRLGYDNFYAITRYNRSKRYAMAVIELALQLRRAREGASP